MEATLTITPFANEAQALSIGDLNVENRLDRISLFGSVDLTKDKRGLQHARILRAVLEATAFQTKEVLDAMNADSGVDLTALKVDGGMVVNETLMQFQADILGVPVIRPVVAETTALGAAYAAGLAVGFWESEDDIRNNWAESKRWEPQMDEATRAKLYKKWKKAVTKTFDWVDSDD